MLYHDYFLLSGLVLILEHHFPSFPIDITVSLLLFLRESTSYGRSERRPKMEYKFKQFCHVFPSTIY